jgi:predicted small integral membrane protein
MTDSNAEFNFSRNALSMKNAFPNATLSDSNKMASVGLGLAYDAINRFIKFSA